MGGKGSTGTPLPHRLRLQRGGGEEARPTGNGPRFKSRIITVIIKIKGRRERTHSSKENGKKGSGGGEVPRGSCARHPPHNCGWGLRPPPASPRSPFGEPGHRASPPHRTSLGLSPRARPRAQARARTRRTPSPPPTACTPAVRAPALRTGRGRGGRETNGKNNPNKSLSLSLKRRYGAVRWES